MARHKKATSFAVAATLMLPSSYRFRQRFELRNSVHSFGKGDKADDDVSDAESDFVLIAGDARGVRVRREQVLPEH